MATRPTAKCPTLDSWPRRTAPLLYGTTYEGGSAGCGGLGCGTVFKLTRANGKYTESILYSFQGGDGAGPYGGLIADKTGALYGTTSGGGAYSNGTAFKLTPSGGTYTESVIHSFGFGSDGSQPQAGLVADAAGALYGTTRYGGNTACIGGCGVVFKLTPAGSTYTESIVYNFAGNDGAQSYAGLLFDAKGALWGTTSAAGTGGFGTVFEVTP